MPNSSRLLSNPNKSLQAEEESLQRATSSTEPLQYTYRSTGSSYASSSTGEDRTRKQPPLNGGAGPSFDTAHLRPLLTSIAQKHKLSRSAPSEDVVQYLALALRFRLQELVVQMKGAAEHRTDAQFDRAASFYELLTPSTHTNTSSEGTPMWGIRVRSDVAKQLSALERVEREEELRIRRERKERAELAARAAAALAAQADAQNAAASQPSSPMDVDDDFDSFAQGGSGGPKKKRKKDGPGVTAKNMSEDVRKKMSNAVASQAAGLGGKYAWMTQANANAASGGKKAAAKTATATSSSTSGANATSSTANNSPTTTTGSGWVRPYVSASKKAQIEKEKENEGSAENEDEEEDKKLAITLRDALFVIEKERGHGGGRGSARGWT